MNQNPLSLLAPDSLRVARDVAASWLVLFVVACGGSESGNGPQEPDADTSGDTITSDGGLDGDDGTTPDAGEPDDTVDPDDVDTVDRDTSLNDADAATDPDGQGGGDTADARDDDGRDDDAVEPDDALDGDSDNTDTTDADDVRVFVPGTLPLPDYIECDENSDCPNGTGNCLTVLTMNRGDSSGRLRIPMNEVFPALSRTGVCSLDCVVGEAACSTLALTVDPTPWNCQVVYADDSAYPIDTSGARPTFPFNDQIDPGEMAAGPAFGALCRPPFERSEAYAPDFCVECSSALNCHPGSACVFVSPWAAGSADAGVCLSPCAVGGGCPSGFECRQPDAVRDGLITGEETQEYCFPTLGSCSRCVDADGDGFGVGGCASSGAASAVDCDDLDPLAWWEGPGSVHPFPEVCGADEDANCNGIADRTEQVGTVAFGTSHCGECGDVCDRSAPQASVFECVRLTTGIEGTCRPVCDEPTRFFDCDGVPDNGCEAEVTDPNLLFVPDCDRDGVGRANFAPQFDCASSGNFTIFADFDGDDSTDDRQDCPVVLAVETEGSGFGEDCDDGDDMVSPFGLEVCDGIDNDCDGATDPYELFQLGDACVPGDAGVVGACRTGATRVCDDVGGVTCQPATPTVELCDGIDNDCDGVIDDLGAPTPANRLGEACRASTDPGPCGAGALVCRSGGLVCAPALLPEGDVPGDGNDSDCDGVDADTERALFVAVGGATVQGPGPLLGSAENPVGTLERAYELIRVREFTTTPVTQIILAAGDYALPHGIAPLGAGFTIMGGWEWNPDTNAWTPPTSTRSNIEFLNVCPCSPAIDSTGVCVQTSCEPDNGYLPAINVINPSGVRMANINVFVAAQPAAFGPVVGLACSLIGTGDGPVASCGALELNQVQIEMENAQAGAPHTGAATAGEAGQQSSSQAPPPCGSRFNCGQDGFTGAASTCGANGGTGAGVGRGSEGSCFGGLNFAFYAPARAAAAGAPADLGGAAGAITTYDGSCVVSTTATQGGRGRTRLERGLGSAAGTGAPPAAPLSPAFAAAGGSGLPGGGGGGGGARGNLEITFGEQLFGGGGSSGGCGGSGGAAGRNGGTVIGLLIDDPLAAPILRSVEVNVGSGGAGGAGQAAGAGGTGIGPSSQGAFTLGGASGHGAGGGGGGGGAGGSAIGIARWPAVRVVLTPSVGSAGSGGAGGAAGPGATGGIRQTLDAASTLFETAASGLAGTTGAPGVSARFCSLAPGAPPAGEVACR